MTIVIYTLDAETKQFRRLYASTDFPCCILISKPEYLFQY